MRSNYRKLFYILSIFPGRNAIFCIPSLTIVGARMQEWSNVFSFSLYKTVLTKKIRVVLRLRHSSSKFSPCCLQTCKGTTCLKQGTFSNETIVLIHIQRVYNKYVVLFLYWMRVFVHQRSWLRKIFPFHGYSQLLLTRQ